MFVYELGAVYHHPSEEFMHLNPTPPSWVCLTQCDLCGEGRWVWVSHVRALASSSPSLHLCFTSTLPSLYYLSHFTPSFTLPPASHQVLPHFNSSLTSTPPSLHFTPSLPTLRLLIVILRLSSTHNLIVLDHQTRLYGFDAKPRS